MSNNIDFPVIELRRYAVQHGANEHFARYFESYFPEAFQQLGAMVFGQFLERGNPAVFTWLRGFRDMPSRLAVNEAFYSGPLWNEHAATMNSQLVDHTNVMLLRPLHPEKGVILLPTVDPVHEEQGAQGILGAHIFAVNANQVEEFAGQAEPVFAAYRSAGAREAAILTTLDVPNNYPRHPIRTDGPFLIWLGIFKDDQTFETTFRPLAKRASDSLAATGLLRDTPELITLDPGRRSRLRWLAE